MDAKTMIDDARRYREEGALVGKGGVVFFSKVRFRAG